MKIHQEPGNAGIYISRYGDGYVEIADQRLTTACLLTEDTVQTLDSSTDDNDTLLQRYLARFIDLQLECVIFGSGKTLMFPHPSFAAKLAAHGIGFDVMDSAAACRTFNILRNENRTIAALLKMP